MNTNVVKMMMDSIAKGSTPNNEELAVYQAASETMTNEERDQMYSLAARCMAMEVFCLTRGEAEYLFPGSLLPFASFLPCSETLNSEDIS